MSLYRKGFWVTAFASSLLMPCAAAAVVDGKQPVVNKQQARGAVPRYRKKTMRSKSVGEDYILLQRGACYGKCPQYSLRIAGTRVHFLGLQNVAVAGAADAMVEAAEVAALKARLRDPGLARLQDIYGMGQPGCGQVTTDMASSQVEWQIDGHKHRFEIYQGCGNTPSALLELPSLIDAAAGSEQWVSDRPER